jgi:hypothetical protein
MSSKRTVIVASVLATVLALPGIAAETKTKKASAASTKAAEKAPRLTIVEPVKEFGTVAKGEKLDHSFLVKNTGDADLLIVAARPACGCTVADFDKVIKPGQTGKVSAHVDTTAFAGPISKTVTLETNDPSTPSSMLTIHATVQPFVEAYPAGFVRYNLLQGDAETQTVTIYSEEEEPFEIKNVDVPAGGWARATFEKIENEADRAKNAGRAGQNQYKVNITVGGSEAKLGPLADKVRIVTNSKHQPEYFVSISGVIRPTFRVEPTVLNFGEVASTDAAATRSLVFQSNDLRQPERFAVTKVESTVPGIVTSVKPGAQKGIFEITLQVDKAATPGDIDGAVKIYTTDTTNPVVTVPVRGTIKATTISEK